MVCTLLLSLCIGLAPTTVSATVEALPFEPEVWSAAPQVELRVVEKDKTITYTGVPLAVVLKSHLNGSNRMADLRALSDAIILVGAADKYQAAVSAAAVAMDPKGEHYLLALRRDGKPLGEGQGPVRLVIPGDPQHVRWVRMINSLKLARLRPSE